MNTLAFNSALQCLYTSKGSTCHLQVVCQGGEKNHVLCYACNFWLQVCLAFSWTNCSLILSFHFAPTTEDKLLKCDIVPPSLGLHLCGLWVHTIQLPSWTCYLRCYGVPFCQCCSIQCHLPWMSAGIMKNFVSVLAAVCASTVLMQSCTTCVGHECPFPQVLGNSYTCTFFYYSSGYCCGGFMAKAFCCWATKLQVCFWEVVIAFWCGGDMEVCLRRCAFKCALK